MIPMKSKQQNWESPSIVYLPRIFILPPWNWQPKPPENTPKEMNHLKQPHPFVAGAYIGSLSFSWKLGRNFKYVLMFTPKLGEDEPIFGEWLISRWWLHIFTLKLGEKMPRAGEANNKPVGCTDVSEEEGGYFSPWVGWELGNLNPNGLKTEWLRNLPRWFSDSWGIFILLSICMHLQVWPSFKIGFRCYLTSRTVEEPIFLWGVENVQRPWLVILPVGNKKTVKPMEGHGAPKINGLLHRFSWGSIPTPFMTRRGPPALPFWHMPRMTQRPKSQDKSLIWSCRGGFWNPFWNASPFCKSSWVVSKIFVSRICGRGGWSPLLANIFILQMDCEVSHQTSSC